MKCLKAYRCQKMAGEESMKGKRFFQMPINSRVGNEMAPQYRYGSYCGNIQFQPENGLPGPCHRWSGTQVAGIGWKTTVERSYCPHWICAQNEKFEAEAKPKPRPGLVLHVKKGLAKGTNLMYANTIYGVLEYHSMYFLYNNNKNQWW